MNNPADGIINFTLAGLTVNQDAVIWQEIGGNVSQKIVKRVVTDLQMLQNSSNRTNVSSGALSESKLIEQLIADDMLLKSTKASYKTTILTTNFSIPLARFDVAKPQYDPVTGNRIGDSKGSISLFSSIGAGIGICGGRVTRTRDSTGTIIDEEFSNTVGLYLGVLYQAGTGDTEKNVFAPTLSLSILDIQVGIGYDYGKVPVNQERTFVTLSYGIPIYKLFSKGYRIWLDSKHKPFDVKKI